MLKRPRHIQLGNEIADILEAKHFVVPTSMRTALCDEFKTMLPVLYSEAPDKSLPEGRIMEVIAEAMRKVEAGIMSADEATDSVVKRIRHLGLSALLKEER